MRYKAFLYFLILVEIGGNKRNERLIINKSKDVGVDTCQLFHALSKKAKFLLGHRNKFVIQEKAKKTTNTQTSHRPK